MIQKYGWPVLGVAGNRTSRRSHDEYTEACGLVLGTLPFVEPPRLGAANPPESTLIPMDIQSGVEIVIGRALAGKTQRLLREYRQELSRAVADGRPGTTLWLSTTSRACRQVLNQLLDDSLPASFAPNVLTFESFAERVLQQTGTGWIPVSPARKRMLA